MKDFERTTRKLFTQCRKACVGLAIAAAVSMSLISTTAFGGQVVGTTIVSTLTVSSNLLLVVVANNSTSTPSCASGAPNVFAIGANDKFLVASVLLAQSTGKTVDLYGSGNCNVWSTAESLIYFAVH